MTKAKTIAAALAAVTLATALTATTAPGPPALRRRPRHRPCRRRADRRRRRHQWLRPGLRLSRMPLRAPLGQLGQPLPRQSLQLIARASVGARPVHPCADRQDPPGMSPSGRVAFLSFAKFPRARSWRLRPSPAFCRRRHRAADTSCRSRARSPAARPARKATPCGCARRRSPVSHRHVGQIDDAEDDGLRRQLFQHLEIELGLRRLDGDLRGFRAFQFGQE